MIRASADGHSPGQAKDLARMPLTECASNWRPSPEGLSLDEAKQRLERYGYNELPEEKTNPLLKFLSYFWGPIPWMIEVAVDPVGAWSGIGPTFASSLLLLVAMPSSASGKSFRRATPSPR